MLGAGTVLKLNEADLTDSNSRHSPFPIDTFFLDRWSPRAFSDDSIPEETMLTLLEAAHWAPSSGNNQPWRFIYARRDTAEWPALLDLLTPGNQRWAKNAAALVIFVSKTFRVATDGSHKPAYTHAFDTGAAWFSLAAQAMRLGFHAHGMEGVDRDKAMAVLGIPEGYRVEAAAAIGRIAPASTLPDDLATREAPSQRRPLSEVAFAGRFRSED
jgi:nitroreductase